MWKEANVTYLAVFFQPFGIYLKTEKPNNIICQHILPSAQESEAEQMNAIWAVVSVTEHAM
jgi:hypothetical protein